MNLAKAVGILIASLGPAVAGGSEFPLREELEFEIPFLGVQRSVFWPLPGFAWEISLGGIEVEATEVEEDIGLEAFSITIPTGLLHQA